MNIAKFCIRHKVTTLLAVIMIAVFGAVYNGLTGWFGDILSYSRLMALMLAGSVIAQVFNTLAAMPSSGGVTVVSLSLIHISEPTRRS